MSTASRLTTLKSRASLAMTRAIEKTLNEDDEAKATWQPNEPRPAETESPQIDLERDFAIRRISDARVALDKINVALFAAKGGDPTNYYRALRDVRETLSGIDGAKSHLIQARKETESPRTAQRLNEAERKLAGADYNIKLMGSPLLRFLTGGWFITGILVIAIGYAAIYFAFFGSSHIPNSASASVADKAAAVPGFLTTSASQATDLVDRATKLIEALAKLFSAIPALLAAAGVIISGISRAIR